MTRIGQIRPEFVEFIPEKLEPGVLYVSRRYSTASHLCCCGCGMEVVTPLNPAKWGLTESNGTVSLNPSIGNWNFPCRSHYWISGNRVQWAAAMSAERIAAVKARDRRDVDTMVSRPERLFVRFVKAVATKIRGWFS
ncbi:hypothetical protein ASD54_03505 [Rhizobium sp. Root149]|uniref:DUF6527 family protein n=1 Tax=Rhizobium sp. Root149 TaxID=1736473 RepID=UPI000712DBF3|nr:DUF6527 family protein [Rhizobium sp. Root149]KQZ63428.1 hypothetical protein ASD54_03505 [Rhizobium sp. Root149]